MTGQVLLRMLSAKLAHSPEPITQACDKVHQRFVRQSVAAILGAGSLVVTEMARRLCEPGETPGYAAKRLCRKLVVETWHLPTH